MGRLWGLWESRRHLRNAPSCSELPLVVAAGSRIYHVTVSMQRVWSSVSVKRSPDYNKRILGKYLEQKFELTWKNNVSMIDIHFKVSCRCASRNVPASRRLSRQWRCTIHSTENEEECIQCRGRKELSSGEEGGIERAADTGVKANKQSRLKG